MAKQAKTKASKAIEKNSKHVLKRRSMGKINHLRFKYRNAVEAKRTAEARELFTQILDAVDQYNKKFGGHISPLPEAADKATAKPAKTAKPSVAKTKPVAEKPSKGAKVKKAVKGKPKRDAALVQADKAIAEAEAVIAEIEAKPAKPSKALREATNVATQLLGLGTKASVKSLGHGALTLAFVNEALVVAIGDHGAMIDRHEVLALYTWLRAHCDSHVVGK